MQPTFGILSTRTGKNDGFLEVPWIADQQAYDVAAPYLEVRMSIFDNEAHTVKSCKSFHISGCLPQGPSEWAAIFAEDKRLAYLLPLIVEAIGCSHLPPLFWVQDDKTIPLHRQTLWLHASTIQWLSDTGRFTPELRDEIQPRLDNLNLQLDRCSRHNPETSEMERATQGKVKHAGKPGFRLTGPTGIAASASATCGN